MLPLFGGGGVAGLRWSGVPSLMGRVMACGFCSSSGLQHGKFPILICLFVIRIDTIGR